VGFEIKAAVSSNSVYVIYDSVLTLSSLNRATQGEVRVASRASIFPEDWKYQTLDGPDNGLAVAGYDVAISSSAEKVAVAWLGASGNSLPKPDLVRFMILNQDDEPFTLSSISLGTPGPPLVIDERGLFYGCEGRICSTDNYGVAQKLISAFPTLGVKESAIYKLKGKRFLVTSTNRKLVTYGI
jgi:hypothetical protein